MEKYDHKKIEKKWQEKWEIEGSNTTSENTSKPKFYVLDMFPYPSGAGLHVGHVEGYTATDIYSRYKRASGYNVLHPMGWDAFGLPAENYAIKTGTPPRKTTDESIANFRKQIKNLGLSYDWSREFGTHTPEYYRWTQWLFARFFEKGLVYKKKALVNWDPVDQTVLANEQVLPDGTAERSGAKVEQKELEQWFYKITQYAEELIEGLDTVDWPESTKINQRNWIGKNHGVRYSLKVQNTDLTVETYSTHFEAFYADTFAVIASDHPHLASIIGDVPERDTILTKARVITSERERTAYGVELEPDGIFTGRYLLDPITQSELPLWVANYALADYGTGIIKCSAHDQRDFVFAKKYGLPLRVVLKPDDESIIEQVNSLEICFSDFEHATLLFPSEFAGKRPHTEREAILKYLEDKGYGVPSTQYRLRDWLISRQRYWGAPIPIVYNPEGKAHVVPDEHLPWLLPEDVEYLPKGTSPLGTSKELLERTEKIFGPGWKPEIDTMDTFACSSWYFFRFADPHNEKEFASKQALAKWLPVDLYVGGAEHTVLHLLYARFFTKALRDMGYLSFSEPFLKLRHQGIILAEDSRKMSKRWGNVINPDDMVERFGADSIRLYEMFMGPLEAIKPWNTNNILGVRRFLERVWSLQEKTSELPTGAETETVMHQTIQKVTNDIESLKMNTALSSLMIYTNHLLDLKEVPIIAYTMLLRLLYPFAPHITEELLQRAGIGESIHIAQWPVVDQEKLQKKTFVVSIQINGKVRSTVEAAHDVTKEEIEKLARLDSKVAAWLMGGTERSVIYVPGKVINFVIDKN